MWVDEAIWGHRLHDEQTPWLVFLEFLNVFMYEESRGHPLDEEGKLNHLRYRAHHRLYLRNILFNNPHLVDIRTSGSDDRNRWDEWLKRMTASAAGLIHPDFGYLEAHFHSFDDFCEVVSLVRSTSLEVNSNKRWTSKFVFPYGASCLYEDLDNRTSTNDRRFFGRTGELLYLMLSRAARKDVLLTALRKRFATSDTTWDSIIKCLQPVSGEDPGPERAHAFLPYPTHRAFDDLADDWIAILKLELPSFDVLPHLVNLAGLHILKYQLEIARLELGSSAPVTIVCEVVAPKKTLVREVSNELYQSNNLLPAQAVEAYVTGIERSAAWQAACAGGDAFAKCKDVLSTVVHWEEYDGPSDVDALLSRFRHDALKRHRQHVANIHRNFGREIGLVSRRGTVKLRYAPTDALLKSLLFANVDRRAELHHVLARLYSRYGLVFGDREASEVLGSDDFDKKAFQGNSRRLEQRLASLGLLRRLSDGCAYVLNPYAAVPQ